ncbi:MAG: hypothetical protein CM1200mP16_15380 [Nitrospina sp.]|nr:MAG: hypothetical protein CM1200mP16_15380 [Nitrospina sp.]
MLAREIYEKDPDKYFMPDQYNNDSNGRPIRNYCERENWKQTNHASPTSLSGIGTGGTKMGNPSRSSQFQIRYKCYAIEPANPLYGLEGLKHMESSIIPREIFKEEEIWVEKSAYPRKNLTIWLKLLGKEEGNFSGAFVCSAMLGAFKTCCNDREGVIVQYFQTVGKMLVNFGQSKVLQNQSDQKLPKATNYPIEWAAFKNIFHLH